MPYAQMLYINIYIYNDVIFELVYKLTCSSSASFAIVALLELQSSVLLFFNLMLIGPNTRPLDAALYMYLFKI